MTTTAGELRHTRFSSGLVVTELGDADAGPAVVWLHGYTMDCTIWGPLWDRLPGFRHLGVDLPGHGRSDPPAADLTLPAVAAQVAAVAEAYAATRVVGLSFGSSAALQWAIDRPHSLTHLVVGAPTIAGVEPDPDAQRRYRELMMLRRFTGPGEQMTGLWMTSPPDIFRGTERHPEVRAHLRSVVLRHQWAELANGVMARLTDAVHTDADLGGISARVLAVVGDEDMPTFRGNGDRLAAVVPDCTRAGVPAAGHLVLIEQPATVAPALAAFLAG